MSEMGSIRARFEIDRLARMAGELGYAGTSPQRPTAPGTTASDIAHYVELARQMGLTGQERSTTRELPSLGR